MCFFDFVDCFNVKHSEAFNDHPGKWLKDNIIFLLFYKQKYNKNYFQSKSKTCYIN